LQAAASQPARAPPLRFVTVGDVGDSGKRLRSATQPEAGASVQPAIIKRGRGRPPSSQPSQKAKQDS
jgi:hypothetical protein